MQDDSHGKYEMVYSSVEKYLQEVIEDIDTKKIALKEFQEDFFPLNMQYSLHFWNGYFTSRPNFKELLRDLSYQTYSSSLLHSLELLKDKDQAKSSFQ